MAAQLSPRQCLNIEIVGSDAYRCQNRTLGLHAYCDLHSPTLPATIALAPKPRIDWTMIVVYLMIGLAYCFGYWTHCWCLPWLRGEI